MRSFLVFFLALYLPDLNAQDQAEGYYIALNGDTVNTTYKLKTRPGFFTSADNLYEELPIRERDKETAKFKPADIRGFYIEWKDARAHFVSMPIRNGKQRFLHIVLRSPQLNIYEYSISTNYGISTQFAMHHTGGDTLYIGPDDGNRKTKNRLTEFFAGQENILSFISTMKDLFTRPGMVQYDMGRLIEKILDEYQKQ